MFFISPLEPQYLWSELRKHIFDELLIKKTEAAKVTVTSSQEVDGRLRGPPVMINEAKKEFSAAAYTLRPFITKAGQQLVLKLRVKLHVTFLVELYLS